MHDPFGFAPPLRRKTQFLAGANTPPGEILFATSGSDDGMNEEDWTPRVLRVPEGRDTLMLDWVDGEYMLTAARLRVACRCSACVAAARNGQTPPAALTVTIGSVRPVGRYAVNIGFSDGHERGVYPFSYLRELAA